MKRAVPFLASSFLVLLLLLLPVAAFADVTGDCTITVAGVDANTASTPDAAIVVQKDDSVSIVATGTGDGKFTGHTVYLEYSGIKWPADEGVDDGKTWSGTVDVAKYAKYGVGIYKASGTSSGIPCSGWAFIKVEGNPLGTAAGAAAAGATAIGGGLVAASAVAAARRPRKALEAVLPELQFHKDESADAAREQARSEVEAEYQAGVTTGLLILDKSTGCLGMLPTALIAMALVAVGAGAPAAPPLNRSRVPFRLLFSVSGIIGALLAGLGTLVLAQQYGALYPTAMVTAIWMVVWVVGDVVLTTLLSRSGVKKAYAAIAAGQPAASTPPSVPEAQA